jgi:molybdopterin converting factor small subunit
MCTAPQLTIKVLYFGLIREVTDLPEESLKLSVGATVRQLLGRLVERHGEPFREALLGPDGRPLPNAVVVLDGRDIAHVGGVEAAIERDGQVRIVLMPAFAGGG